MYVGTSLLSLFFHLLCCAAVLKILTYYAQYYAHVCLNLTVLLEYVQKIIDVMTVLLEYIKFYNANNNCGECSIRVYRSLLIF